MQNIFNKITEIKNSGKKAALCIITETKGSTPRKTGSKMIVFEDKSIFGTIGGGSIELQVINDAVNVISANSPGKFSYNLEKDLDMPIGIKFNAQTPGEIAVSIVAKLIHIKNSFE